MVAIFAFTALTVGAAPATANDEMGPPAKLRIGTSSYSECLDDAQTSWEWKEDIGCFEIELLSSRSYPESMGIHARTPKLKASLKNLTTGKNLPLNSFTAWRSQYSRNLVNSYVDPADVELKPGRYELVLDFDYPAGSWCESAYWCIPVSRHVEKRIFQFNWAGKTLIVDQTYKATAAKTVTKSAGYTASKSASYTGAAAHKATATATYKYKGRTYKATASHTVKATHKAIVVSNVTAKSIKRTSSATRSASSTVSQAAADKAAASAATNAAGKSAQDAANKAARAIAESQVNAKAKNSITSKVKKVANAKAKSKITQSVKAKAMKEAKAKALKAAKKKAKH